MMDDTYRVPYSFIREHEEMKKALTKLWKDPFLNPEDNADYCRRALKNVETKTTQITT